MREGWKEVYLGNYITTQKGYAFKSKWYTESGIPVTRVSDFTEDSISIENINYIPENIAKEYLRYKLNHNDIIVQTVGSWQHNPASIVGKVVSVPRNLKIALLNQNAVKLIPTEKIDKQFLYYRLKDESFKKHNLNHAQGAANQASITLDSIKGFSFFIPPLPTQLKIASILSGYDDLIENNLQRIKLLEEQAQLTYKDWFVRMKFPGHEMAVIGEESGLPVGWKKKKIGDFCKVKGGKRLPKGHSLVEYETEHPYIRVKNLNRGTIDQSSLLYVTEETFKKISRYTISTKDIYVSNAGTIGLVGIVPNHLNEASLTENCAKITKIEIPHLQEYLYYFLLSSRGQYQIESRTGGSSQPKLALYRIAGITFVKPKSEILEQFFKYSKKHRNIIENLQNQNQRLKEARDLLLPRLMMGVFGVEALLVDRNVYKVDDIELERVAEGESGKYKTDE